MSRSLVSVVRHREELRARAEAQRTALAGMFRELDTPALRMADNAFRIVRAWRARPVLLVATTAVLLAVRRHPKLFWTGRILTFWELYRTIRAQWRPVADDHGSA